MTGMKRIATIALKIQYSTHTSFRIEERNCGFALDIGKGRQVVRVAMDIR